MLQWLMKANVAISTRAETLEDKPSSSALKMESHNQRMTLISETEMLFVLPSVAPMSQLRSVLVATMKHQSLDRKK